MAIRMEPPSAPAASTPRAAPRWDRLSSRGTSACRGPIRGPLPRSCGELSAEHGDGLPADADAIAFEPKPEHATARGDLPGREGRPLQAIAPEWGEAAVRRAG